MTLRSDGEALRYRYLVGDPERQRICQCLCRHGRRYEAAPAADLLPTRLCTRLREPPGAVEGRRRGRDPAVRILPLRTGLLIRDLAAKRDRGHIFALPSRESVTWPAHLLARINLI